MASEPMPPADIPVREEQVGDVHLIYKIEGQPNDIPVFELARTLEALGTIIEEADRVINAEQHRLVVKVKPFQEGSFLMDLVVSVQHNPSVLFFLSHPEAIDRIKKVFEYLGLIKKGREIIASLLELIDHLKTGKPAKVEPLGPDEYSYTNHNGQELVISGTVHNLVNNVTIQNFIYQAVASPLQREGVEGLSTYLQDAPQETKQYLPKQEVPAIQAFSSPEPEAPKVEVIENTTIEMLHPKAGAYGEPEGVWTFTRAGTNTKIRASIVDPTFLAKYQRGVVRFFHNDLLKVRLKHEQTIKNRKVTNKFEIVDVMDYTKAKAKSPDSGTIHYRN